MTTIYVIGSLRNPAIPILGCRLRDAGFDVFDDWFAAGKIADDEWQAYETTRGRNYAEALRGYASDHVFMFDHYHLERADIALLALPAGKSGHLEFGFIRGRCKPGFVLFAGAPERWDQMYKFANGVAFSVDELLRCLAPWAGYTWQEGGIPNDFILGEGD